MTKQELDKLQGLINSGSPTNWELVRLILEADGETDGKLMVSMFSKYLINYDWNIDATNYIALKDSSLWLIVTVGADMANYLNKYSYEFDNITLSDTKAYERFTKDKRSNRFR